MSKSMMEMTSSELLAVVERFQEAHPHAFVAADVVSWAIAEGISPAMTDLDRHMAAERLNEAMDQARDVLPDGTEVSRFLDLDPSPASDPALTVLSEKPEGQLTYPEAVARLRSKLEKSIADCTLAVNDAEHGAMLFPEKADEFRKSANFFGDRLRDLQDTLDRLNRDNP
jgi:hypothetical protein